MESKSAAKPPLPPSKKRLTSPKLEKKENLGVEKELINNLKSCYLRTDVVTDSGGSVELFDSGFLSGSNLSSKDDIAFSSFAPSVLPINRETKTLEEDSFIKKSNDAIPCISKLCLESQNPKVYSRSDSGIDIQDTSSLNSPCDPELSPSKHINLNSINEVGEIDSVENSPDVVPAVSQKLLQTVFLPNEDGDTQLHLAIIHGYIEIVFGLIKISPDPRILNLMNDLGQTALHLAVLTRQPKIVRRLALAGARLSARDNNGNTPLHVACDIGDLQCVQALTKKVTKLEQLNGLMGDYCELEGNNVLPLELRNYEGFTCVHLATLRGYLEVLQYLLCVGADINAKEGRAGRTPLHFAVYLQSVPLIKFLCDFGADIEAETYGCHTPLQIAALNSPSLVNVLRQLGATSKPLSDSECDSDCSSDSDEKPLTLHNHFNDIKINGEPLDTY